MRTEFKLSGGDDLWGMSFEDACFVYVSKLHKDHADNLIIEVICHENLHALIYEAMGTIPDERVVVTVYPCKKG